MSFVSYGPTPGAASATGIEESLKGVKDASQRQMQWNRPNTANPWAQQFSAADGSIHQQFTGPMAGAQESLMGQALRNMGSPMDFSQYNVGTGDAHRQAAIDAAGSQMGDWLGGIGADWDAQSQQRAANEGYAPGSEPKGWSWTPDAQASINNAAIGLGTQGGAMRQSQDMAMQQQRLSEALRQRSYPMDALKTMQGLGEQPGVDADNSILDSATMDYEARLKDYLGKRGEYEQGQADEMASGLGFGTDLFGSALTFGQSAKGSSKKKPAPRASSGYDSGVRYT